MSEQASGGRGRVPAPGVIAPAGEEARGPRGALATPHVLATEAGLEAARAGGSAIDAALAAAAMLAVVYPHQCSLGGDAFALVSPPSGRVLAINGSGRAPRGVTAAAIRRDHERMPVTGPLTVTVPGVLAAWETIHATGGRLPLARILEPAIARARHGTPVSRSLDIALRLDQRELATAPGISTVFFTDGRPLSEGDLFRQPSLAESLEAVAAGGVREFYHGPLGARFAEGLRELGSPIQAVDLGEHGTTTTEALAGRYRHWEVLTTPPNSQGFALLEILGVLEGLAPAFDPAEPAAVRVARLFALTAADRDRHLGDERTPVAALLAPEHIAWLREAVDAGPGDGPAARSEPLGRDTVAICAADGDWSIVLIQSVFHSFGARIMEPSTGIIVQNRGASFSLVDGAPNRLLPGGRPPHTLMPVLVRRGERWAFLSGAMGGKAQPQIQAEILGRLLDLGRGPAAAVTAPRWVLGGLDIGSAEGVVRLEAPLGYLGEGFEQIGFATQTLAELDEEVGQAQVVAAVEDGFAAAADPRSDGGAAAW